MTPAPPRRTGFAGWLVALAAPALLAGCKPPTDLNKSCVLIRPNPDGGTPLALREGEVQAAQGRNKDFIALGAVECEDLLCVRDSNLVTDAGPADDARGYCSRSCLSGSVCPSYDSALDLGASRLNCRPLLLDQRSLAGLDAGDLSSVRDPYFCARGEIPDGG
jgi:hypothetical protein